MLVTFPSHRASETYIKIENFQTINLLDKILLEGLFFQNVMMSESFLFKSFKFIEKQKSTKKRNIKRFNKSIFYLLNFLSESLVP